MWLVIAAMRRPITILVVVCAIALCSILALRRMQVDIFPDLGAPAIYVVQPYGGMDPSQMESYITYNYDERKSCQASAAARRNSGTFVAV